MKHFQCNLSTILPCRTSVRSLWGFTRESNALCKVKQKDVLFSSKHRFHSSKGVSAIDFGKTPKKHSVDLLVIVDFEATCDQVRKHSLLFFFNCNDRELEQL